jgi:predicted transcriptional regulator
MKITKVNKDFQNKKSTSIVHKNKYPKGGYIYEYQPMNRNEICKNYRNQKGVML